MYTHIDPSIWSVPTDVGSQRPEDDMFYFTHDTQNIFVPLAMKRLSYNLLYPRKSFNKKKKILTRERGSDAQ